MAPFFCFENFIKYLEVEKRFSEHTIIAYRKDLSQFFDYSLIDSEKDLQEIETSIIRGWIVHLMNNDICARSVNRKLSSLRTFFKWLKKNDIIDVVPTKLINGPKSEKRLPNFAKESDLSKDKLDFSFDDSFEGQRDKLMIELFYQTGIRVSELINLKLNDYNKSRIKVLGKRNKERIIPISNKLFQSIESYVELRNGIDSFDQNLIITIKGKKINPSLVYRKIKCYLSNATELEKKSPHVLRHTFATHMLNNGAGLEVLKELLGHANLSATQVYTHNSFTQLTKIYSQAHPRGRKK